MGADGPAMLDTIVDAYGNALPTFQILAKGDACIFR
jgi:hypothetical protein